MWSGWKNDQGGRGFWGFLNAKSGLNAFFALRNVFTEYLILNILQKIPFLNAFFVNSYIMGRRCSLYKSL